MCACSVSQLCLTLWTPWTVGHQASLSVEFYRQAYWSGLPFPPPCDKYAKVYHSVPVFTVQHKTQVQTHPSIWKPPPPIFPSIRVLSNESAVPIRWPKYWRFSFSINPSNEYSSEYRSRDRNREIHRDRK